MKIELLSCAVNDLANGRDFYDRIDAGLGDYFLDSLYSDIESLRVYAGVHVRVFGYLRALSKRFPYAVYYRFDNDVISVWRVLDCRQHPSKTRRQIEQE
jgi:hypothetical protein